MRGYLLCSIAFGVVACNVDQEFADAIPTSDQVSIKVPQSGWDTRFQTRFQTSTPVELELFGGEGGLASACVFSAAELPQ